jgi:hypothetical protein
MNTSAKLFQARIGGITAMELRVFSIFLTSGKKGFFSKRHFEMA